MMTLPVCVFLLSEVVRYGVAVRMGAQVTETWIFWIPLAPFGNGEVRAVVCTCPSRSVARQASWCCPGFASHSRYHWRQ